MLVCYPERQSSMLEGSNACGLTKEEEETYVSASQCVSPIPSILDNRDHFTRAQIRTLSFVFVSPNFPSNNVSHCQGLVNGKEKEATYVSVPHPASPALWDTHDVSLCFIFCLSTTLWWFFSWQLAIGDLVTANSRVCQLSSVQWPRQRWVFGDTAHIFNRSQSDGVRRLITNAIKKSMFF